MGTSVVTCRDMGRQSVGVDRAPTARAVCGSPLSARQCSNPRRHEARAPELEQIMGAAPQRPLPLDLLKAPQPEPGQASHAHLPKDRFDGAAAQLVDSLPETGQQLPLHPGASDPVHMAESDSSYSPSMREWCRAMLRWEAGDRQTEVRVHEHKVCRTGS